MSRATSARVVLILGAISALISVMAGAYGAHAFSRQATPDQAALFATALRYHQFHSLGLLAVGTLAIVTPGPLWTWVGVLMTAGIILFSGALYMTAMTGYHLGMVAPAGGTAFMAAWALFAIAAWRRPAESR